MTAARLHISIVCLLALVAGCLWSIFPPDIPFLLPDSGSYLRFDSTRATGYPLLLNVLYAIADNPTWIKSAQLSVMLISFSWFSLACGKFFQAKWIALPIQVALVFNPLLMRFAFTVLTEAFFISILAIWIVFIFYMVESNKNLWSALGAFFFACLILIKPLAFVWFPAIAVIFIWNILDTGWHSVWKRMTLFILVTFLVLVLGGMYRSANVNERGRGSFLGGQLIGKTAFVTVDPSSASSPDASEKINSLMSDAKNARHSLPDFRQRYLFSENFYDYIRFQHHDDIFNVLEKKSADDDPLKRLSLSIVRAGWKDYLREVRMTVFAMWSLGELQTRKFANEYIKVLDTIIPTLPTDVTIYRPGGRSFIVVLALKVFMAMTFLSSLWAVLYVASGRFLREERNRSAMFGLFIIAVATHGYMACVSIFQTALIRYVIGVWPLLLVLLFGGLSTLRITRLR